MDKIFEETEDYLNEKSKKVLKFIYSYDYKPMNLKGIMEVMQVPKKDERLLFQIIESLEKEGKVFINKKRKIIPITISNINEGKIIYGIYRSTSRGFGFVILENNENNEGDIFIPPQFTKGAMNKDKVFCIVKKCKFGSKSYEGEIIKVVEKGKSQIVGTLQKGKSFSFVVPDDKNMSHDIYIPKKKTLGALDGHKVIVKINKTYDKGKNPEGEVIEIIGHINDPGVDIISIIRQFELPMEFPNQVYKEVENIADYVLEEDYKNRKDLRNLQTVTIDGEDAKDLDDAITIQKLENGNFYLGVHIADVTHYVKENSNLDKEALNRGTSVYLIDRVIPMLPHKLSNGICSLNAGVDRLALTCFMEIDKKGEVISHEICESIINVNKRMTYTVVADLLTNENSKFLNEYKDFIEMFKNMEELRNILLEKRVKRGSIEFDLKEVKVILDEDRKPIEVKLYERNIATSIIEEFMLATNETIAEHYFWLELPFIYRSHEEPDSEKINNLAYFISKFGYFFKGNTTYSKSLQNVILKSKNTEEEIIINRVVLRSLKQAKYTAENSGHFGLAAKYYCHFTSPIRRYPDLQIHRIIKQSLNNKLDKDKTQELYRKMPDIAKKCSTRERLAEDAEKETIQLKKVEFMKDKVGEIFHAVISGVVSSGLFVELPNGIEGRVYTKNLTDDSYYFDENNFQYVGEKNTYSLGDKVKVILLKANLYEKTLEFDFYDKDKYLD